MQRFVTQALTDIDLFSSYGLTQKAIDLLEVVLQRVPGHAQTLERLLDHYLGAGDEARTAELAAQLERIHTERGNTAAAERFSDLRQRYSQVARTAPSRKKQAPKEFHVVSAAAQSDQDEPLAPAEEAETALEEPAAPAAKKEANKESAVHELDLSEEWAALATEIDVTPSEAADAPAAEPRNASESRGQAAPEFDIPAAKSPAVLDKEAEMQAALRADPPARAPRKTSNADFELQLDTSQAAGKGSRGGPSTAKEFFEALSSDLDAALPSLKGDRDAQKAHNEAVQAKEVAKQAAPRPSEPSDGQASPLSEIFDQFRSEVGELGADDEDLETHYNLGIAYREMGLIEEAISEFQKVAKGSSNGQAFRYAMQCCTLLGLAFMEKGQPAIAATWYERALAMPGLDQESILALRYDLGVAQELAGDMAGARKSFSQVYGMNIDYRDVAERLSSLGNER
jgi:tetratricopeptide (TPR) repeat protein